MRENFDVFPFFLHQTTFENGNLKLTTHRIVWDDLDQQVRYSFSTWYLLKNSFSEPFVGHLSAGCWPTVGGGSCSSQIPRI